MICPQTTLGQTGVNASCYWPYSCIPLVASANASQISAGLCPVHHGFTEPGRGPRLRRAADGHRRLHVF